MALRIGRATPYDRLVHAAKCTICFCARFFAIKLALDLVACVTFFAMASLLWIFSRTFYSMSCAISRRQTGAAVQESATGANIENNSISIGDVGIYVEYMFRVAGLIFCIGCMFLLEMVTPPTTWYSSRTAGNQNTNSNFAAQGEGRTEVTESSAQHRFFSKKK